MSRRKVEDEAKLERCAKNVERESMLGLSNNSLMHRHIPDSSLKSK